MSHKPSDGGSPVSRRRFLQTTGAGVGLATVAGCLGGGGGDGGDGGGDGGDGDGGDGGDGGTATPEMQTISYATPPIGMPIKLVKGFLEDEGLIDQKMSEDRYTLDWKLTWDDVTLFAANKVDLTGLSYYESAILATEQDLDLVHFGNVQAATQGVHVRAGSPYDPAEAGSKQAAVDNLVEDGARVAHGGWQGGNIPFYQRIFKEIYGYDFVQDGGDFNTFSTDYGAMSKLLRNEEVDAAGFSPTSGGAVGLASGEFATIYWIRDTYSRKGWGTPPLLSLGARRSKAKEHKPAAINMIELWQAGMDILFEEVESLRDDDSMPERLGVESMREVNYILDRWMGLGQFSDAAPILTRNTAFTEGDIEKNNAIMANGNEAGVIPDGYENHLELLTKSELENL